MDAKKLKKNLSKIKADGTKTAVEMFNLAWNYAYIGDFLVEMDFEIAKKALKKATQHNGFIPADVITFLERMDKLIPRSYYQKDNPNNDQREYEILIGKEGSPVVYIRYSNYCEKYHHKKPDWKEIEILAKGLLEPDEFDLDDVYSPLPNHEDDIVGKELRLWWD